MTKIIFTLQMLVISLIGFSQVSLPYYEDFSTQQIPTGWTVLNDTWSFSAEAGRFTSSENGFITSSTELPLFGGDTLADIATPYFDVSGVTGNLTFSFEQKYTRILSPAEAYVLLTVDDGATWDTIHSMDFSTDDHLIVKDLTSYISGASQIQLRFMQVVHQGASGGLSSSNLWEFDDVRVYEQMPYDLALISINTPGSGCESADSVNITIKNMGSQPVTDQFMVSYSLDGGSTWIDENIDNDIPAANIINYTFLTDATLLASTTSIIAKVSLATDQSPNNNQITKNLSILPSVQVFPYNEDFESDNGGWFTEPQTAGNQTTWAWGTPNSSNLVGGANGSANAWATNLTGQYGLYETSYLYSPCFDLSSLNNPVIELDLWYQLDGSAYGLYSGVFIEYSLDNGETWNILGTNYDGGSNWYDNQYGWYGMNNDWKHALHSMADLANEPKVNLRFNFSGMTNQQEGVALDNIYIHDAFSNDLSVTAINTPTGGCSLSDETVNITVTNLGAANVNTFDMAYSIDGGSTWTTETISQAIAAGQSANIDFTQTVDLSASDIYTLQAKVILSGDENPSNDEISATVVSQPSLSGSEIFEDFETPTSAQYWLLDKAWNSSVNDWELGTPSTTNLSSAYSGSQAWVTNANGNYTNVQEAYVVSPCMDITGITNPAIEFYLNENLSQASLDVEYSVDGGLSWQTLGSDYSGFWYESPYSSFTFATNGWEDKKRTLVGISDIETNPSNLKFRFKFIVSDISNGTNEGVAIDNFRIYQDDALAATVGVSRVETTPTFSIYPNPATNNVQLTIGNKQLGESIQILDITGKSMNCHSERSEESISLDVSNLQKGIYFVKIGTEMQKLIKE